MQQMTIYGDPISGNCLKVKWTAERLGLPFRWIDVDVMKRETRDPAFLAVNPAGQVPAVVLPDGRTLAQSNAIILHLAEGSEMIPTDAYERARMYEWLFWEQYSHEPYIAVRRFYKTYLHRADDAIDPKLLDHGSKALKRMDEALADRPFFVGGKLTLADICLVAYTRMADEGGFDLAQFPNVAAWVKRVEGELGL